MNGTYYKNPTFPGADPTASGNPPMNNYTDNIVEVDSGGNLPMEQSYIENILRLNKGSHAKAYISFPDSVNWKDKIFDGTIEQAGRDHLVMSLTDGKWVLVPMIYLDYVEFDGKIVYRPGELKR
ncbi:MAG TPA: spore coat protein GerQ [Firmicutes bacterium]|nr:spore coat protein GerQ [Bacillota bacterium]